MIAVEVEMFDGRNMAMMDLQATALDRFWRDQLLAPEGDLELGRARYDAGTKLAQVYDRTGYRQRVTGHYSPPVQGTGEMTDEEAAAAEAYNSAVRKLTAVSPSVAAAVVNLCVHDFDLVVREELVRGLDILIRHWGLR